MLGQHMREGVHFNDTHAPVASVTCVRVLLAITAAAGRLLTQFDVKAAFLTAPLDIELDVILPDGFGIGSDDGQFSSPEGRCRRALTAIPGCPQGSRVWREKLVQVLASLVSNHSCRTNFPFLRIQARTRYICSRGWMILYRLRRPLRMARRGKML